MSLFRPGRPAYKHSKMRPPDRVCPGWHCIISICQHAAPQTRRPKQRKGTRAKGPKTPDVRPFVAMNSSAPPRAGTGNLDVNLWTTSKSFSASPKTPTQRIDSARSPIAGAPASSAILSELQLGGQGRFGKIHTESYRCIERVFILRIITQRQEVL